MTTTTTASSMFSAYASFAGSMMLVRSMANQLIPDPIRSYLYSKLNYLFTPLSSNLTMIIDELSGAARNQVYDAAEVYLKTIPISPSTERLRVRKTSRQKSITIAMHKDEQLSDTFHNVKLTWHFKSTEATNGGNGRNKKSAEKRHFELSFHKKHKDKVIDSYLPHVLARADAIKEEQKVVKLYSRSLCSYDDDMTLISSWGSANLEHPSTFETMALDPEMKKMIMEDLERFVRRREFYNKAGKAWKRGYLLYGPPGTGKSSLIAAMANYLKFDVYDLELASIYSNHELRRVLLSTTNRSILVIEDIDCTVDLKNRKLKDKDYSQLPNKLTLSGLLNFIDGLWSSCGDERIIVFTTNHKDQLDPALLRSGRMDVHIHLSYCTTSGFRILASNYLGIHGGGNDPHPLCSEIEGLIESAEVTPAEVAEELMKSDDADGALQGLVNFLKRKKVESNKTEDKSEGSTEKAKRQKTDEGEETE
ncbi:AAA-ATPase At2g18193-like [Prunus avium]|uniref:AAA-ATPase At2g18193-like n=1 Tax=Prunus avium TaxID=42229 RepID=A0A6P5U3G9_PRUAV|nr:AAA-ATPase At2g18193-like [Prunus avium]